jgi:hypothetical protein
MHPGSAMQTSLTRQRAIRRRLSPSAELRVGEQMRMRMGMVFAMLRTFGAMAAIAQVLH